MKSGFTIRGILPLLCLCTISCSTAPTRFYTLVPPAASERGSHPGYAIQVQSVTLPTQVDQPQFVLRQGQGEIALAEQHQWIAPLPDEYRTALSAQLSEKLGTHDVQGIAKPEAMLVYPIRVRVRRFDSSLSKSIRQEVLWALSNPAGEVAMTCMALLDEEAAGGYLALAEAHQRAISRLAGIIAGSLVSLVNGHKPGCP